MTRHDKWLCMMTPRLKLLWELLSEDGVIFISIDDNEVANLRLLMDEIFGEENFIAMIVWRKKKGGSHGSFADETEYCLVYIRSKEYVFNFNEDLTNLSDYKHRDDRGEYQERDLQLQAKGGYARPNQTYEIEGPDGKGIWPTAGNQWLWTEPTFKAAQARDEILFKEVNGAYKVYFKLYLRDEHGNLRMKRVSTYYAKYNTGDGTREQKLLFEGETPLSFPKPSGMIKDFIKWVTRRSKDAIILDSFAGSGTTMHAVMDLNKEDGGNRKCILVQMTEATEKEPDKNICEQITRERLKRAIDKHNYKDGFTYEKLGQAIDAETLLNGDLPSYRSLAKYVYYLASGDDLRNIDDMDPASYYVGQAGKRHIWLIYKANFDALTKLALNAAIAEEICAKAPKAHHTVYAPTCYLDEDYLRDHRLEFVNIPYGLFKR